MRRARADPSSASGLRATAAKNRLVYVILVECRLVLHEAQAPQPDHNVHNGAPTQGCRTSSSLCPCVSSTAPEAAVVAAGVVPRSKGYTLPVELGSLSPLVGRAVNAAAARAASRVLVSERATNRSGCCGPISCYDTLEGRRKRAGLCALGTE